jgi:hypothetical protein
MRQWKPKYARSKIEGELANNEVTTLVDRLDYDDPLLAYEAASDPDALYYHEAMKEKDSQLFLDCIMREVEDQYNNSHFTVIHKLRVPVWQMRRKQDVKTGILKSKMLD